MQKALGFAVEKPGMNVAIHVEFMRALGKLSAQDRKVTEDMMLRIQSGGITPGMRRHQIVADHEAFTSLSPSMDLRVLAIEDSSCITMLYVDHHDKAYQWAQRNQGRLGTVAPILLAGTAVQSALPPTQHLPQRRTRWLLDYGTRDFLQQSVSFFRPLVPKKSF